MVDRSCGFSMLYNCGKNTYITDVEIQNDELKICTNYEDHNISYENILNKSIEQIITDRIGCCYTCRENLDTINAIEDAIESNTIKDYYSDEYIKLQQINNMYGLEVNNKKIPIIQHDSDEQYIYYRDGDTYIKKEVENTNSKESFINKFINKYLR